MGGKKTNHGEQSASERRGDLLQRPALHSHRPAFGTFLMCSTSRTLSPHSDCNPHRIQQVLAGGTVKGVTLAQATQLAGLS